jgi:soluble lytic murein transglycosylase-like protein
VPPVIYDSGVMGAEVLTYPPAPAPSDPVVAHALEAASQNTGVPRRLLESVAWVESRYSLGAVSTKGARGIMQLMPAAATGIDPHNPVQAAQRAAKLLLHWHAKFLGSWAHALAAYNWGPGNVSRVSDPSAWPDSVRQYVQRVANGAGVATPASVPFSVRGRQ